MKQTAVNWFFEQLTEVDYGCINKTFLQNNNSLAGHKLRELFEQAKAMEKEQMIEFADKYADSDAFYCSGEFDIEKDAEQYYNETYKSK